MIAPKVDLFFVVDGPKLEAQACILAASIQRHFPPDIRRIAYHRQDYALSDYVREFLEACGVEFRPLTNTATGDPNPWSRHWPVGNKLLAKAERRDCDVSVYLDTDMFFRDYVDFPAALAGPRGDGEVLATTADYLAGPLERPEAWKNIYAFFGLPLPEERCSLLAGRRLVLPPYYNGGFVVFREAPIGTAREHFGEAWLKDSLAIDAAEGLADEREGLDQTVMPVTIRRLGARFNLGSRALNYNVRAHGQARYKEAKLVHFHQFSTLLYYQPQAGMEALENIQAIMPAGTLDRFIGQYREAMNWDGRKNNLRDRLCLRPGGALSMLSDDLGFLAERLGSDKGSSKHRYTELYQMLFAPFIHREINFLEMGLQIGGPEHGVDQDRQTTDCPSIKMWLAFFKRARIHGLDVSDFSWFAHDRFTFHRCDMGSRKEIAEVAAALPSMDIVVDDAAHASHHQQAAFLEFFPRLRPGGLYVIEDLRWQPKEMELRGITKTGDLFYNYQVTGRFKHSDLETGKKFNLLRPQIAASFVFQEGYRTDGRHQVVVIHKRL